MRISAVFAPFFTLLAGIAGFYLRSSELKNVFDPVTGLPQRNADTTFWLIILSLIFSIAIIIFAVNASTKHKALKGFESAFGTDPFYYPVLFTVIGIVWIIGTYMYFTFLRGYNALTSIDIYFIIFSVITAVSITYFAIEMYQDSRKKAPYLLIVIPTVFMCFWLIMLYRHNASNPVLLSYAYQCIAIIASTASFYYTSGFLYGKPAPGKSIFAYYTTIYFCAVTLADNHPAGIKLIFCALIAINIIHSSMLLRNLQRR